MTVLRSILKYLGFFLLGAFVSALIAVTCIAYYAIENVAIPPTAKAVAPAKKWINPNLQEISEFGEVYRQEFNLFDQLESEIKKQELPKICKVVCNPSSLDSEKMKTDRSRYLLEFYKENGKRALLDPHFRLKLEEVSFLSDLYPPSLRQVFSAAHQLKDQEPDFLTKLALAVHLEMAAVKEGTSLGLRWEKLKIENDKIGRLRSIVQSCEKGTLPAKQATAECEAHFIN